MKLRGAVLAVLGMMIAWPSVVHSQSWRPLHNQPRFSSPGTALLLTDGTVMVQDSDASDWWRLTPNANGSYLNGAWSQLASLPKGYGPLYYASAVLADGRVIVEGGEYNLGNQQVETNLGAIYDPVTDEWTAVSPPRGWTDIGDAPSVVLPNGKFMIGHIDDTRDALLDPNTMTWTLEPGTGKKDRNAEEGWTLLPDGTVLTVDALSAPGAEKYVPSQVKWISAANTVVRLEDPSSQEIGPAVLRPDGTVFATGANGQGAGHTSVYHPPADRNKPGHWVPGPDFPGKLDIADGPAALLPDGNVLCQASPGIFHPPSHFFEFDGTNLKAVPAPPNAPNDPSFAGRMLVLPTGQVLFTDGSTDVEIYTPTGNANRAWAPTISSVPTQLTRGQTYAASGTQFNGLSQAVAYGDDAQAATNYPLVRLKNDTTGHVFYARTHDHSTMAVATKNTTVSTNFDVPANMETGTGKLVVVANGIASDPVAVTVQ